MSIVRHPVVKLVLILALLVLWSGAGWADEDEPRWEFGILGGFFLVDEDLAGADGPSVEPTLGGRAGGRFLSPRWNWFVDLQVAKIETETFRRDATALTGRAGLELILTPESFNPWFVYLAAGHLDMSFDEAADYYSAIVSAGVGQNVWLSGNKYIRWEWRADHTLADDGLYVEEGTQGDDLDQGQFLIGLTWQVGRRPSRIDSDGDGVRDGRDRCDNTRAGLSVDRHGCPNDRDGDGVVDRRDRCENPRPGLKVDRWGCPTTPQRPQGLGSLIRSRPGAEPADADGDGVTDPNDRCPATLRGVEVDAEGCPRDEDGDGVADAFGMDRCPGTPRGARVDARGCPLDSDGDGVYDGLDDCPDSPAGSEVDPRGCPTA